MTKWATSLLLAALLSPVFAQTLQSKPSTLPKDGVEGLLVNSTISANGMLFFLSFLDFWREKSDGDKYTLEIAENASKRYGNQVWVSFGQRRIFYSNLPIQKEKIRLLSQQAAESSYAEMATLSLPFSGLADPDLAQDEL